MDVVDNTFDNLDLGVNERCVAKDKITKINGKKVGVGVGVGVGGVGVGVVGGSRNVNGLA